MLLVCILFARRPLPFRSIHRHCCVVVSVLYSVCLFVSPPHSPARPLAARSRDSCARAAFPITIVHAAPRRVRQRAVPACAVACLGRGVRMSVSFVAGVCAFVLLRRAGAFDPYPLAPRRLRACCVAAPRFWCAPPWHVQQLCLSLPSSCCHCRQGAASRSTRTRKVYTCGCLPVPSISVRCKPPTAAMMVDPVAYIARGA